MAEVTGISWADSTFNGWVGCTRVSPACDHCYAEALIDTRLHQAKWGAGQPRVRTSAANWRKPVLWNARADEFRQCDVCGWRGDRKPKWAVCPMCHNGLMQPTRRRVFCASLADVFDNEVSVEWLVDVLDLIRRTPSLDWLLLTKRIGRVSDALDDAMIVVKDQQREYSLYLWLLDWIMGKPPANVWLGATICNQAEANRDVPKLLATPARVRFLSIEPMLGLVTVFDLDGPIDVPDGMASPLHWVICGGESGPNARPMHPDWVRSLRDQCAAAGVPFHFKQWGEFLPAQANEADPAIADVPDSRLFWSDGQAWSPHDGQRGGVDLVARVGKKVAGRLLDGAIHDAFPVVRT